MAVFGVVGIGIGELTELRVEVEMSCTRVSLITLTHSRTSLGLSAWR